MERVTAALDELRDLLDELNEKFGAPPESLREEVAADMESIFGPRVSGRHKAKTKTKGRKIR
mgnify:CR=1 FL=1